MNVKKDYVDLTQTARQQLMERLTTHGTNGITVRLFIEGYG